MLEGLIVFFFFCKHLSDLCPDAIAFASDNNGSPIALCYFYNVGTSGKWKSPSHFRLLPFSIASNILIVTSCKVSAIAIIVIVHCVGASKNASMITA